MAKTTVIATRAQWAAYLQAEAEEKARLLYHRSVLRDLVQQAFDVRERMPPEWVAEARSALDEIKE